MFYRFHRFIGFQVIKDTTGSNFLETDNNIILNTMEL